MYIINLQTDEYVITEDFNFHKAIENLIDNKYDGMSVLWWRSDNLDRRVNNKDTCGIAVCKYQCLCYVKTGIPIEEGERLASDKRLTLILLDLEEELRSIAKRLVQTY